MWINLIRLEVQGILWKKHETRGLKVQKGDNIPLMLLDQSFCRISLPTTASRLQQSRDKTARDDSDDAKAESTTQMEKSWDWDVENPMFTKHDEETTTGVRDFTSRTSWTEEMSTERRRRIEAPDCKPDPFLDPPIPHQKNHIFSSISSPRVLQFVQNSNSLKLEFSSTVCSYFSWDFPL